MDEMNPLLFSIGGLVFAIGIFRRDLLTQWKSFTIILAISVALFLTGLVLSIAYAGEYPGSGALLSPLVSLVLYRLSRKVFAATYGREPLDTWLNWKEGMGPDRVFNILYFLTAGCLWTILAAVLP